MEFLTYRHSVNMGDLISALAGIRHLWVTTGKRAIIYQQLNRPGEYYEGAQHPTKDNDGQQVCFNEQMFEMISPLLLTQDYIEDFRVWNGEKVDYDLDVVRLQVYCGAPNYALHKWTWMAYPEMTCDLSGPWIEIPFIHIDYSGVTKTTSWAELKRTMEQTGVLYYTPQREKQIIINFTERYRNHNVNYFFLREYQKHIIFVGTHKEHQVFSKKWGLDIKYWPVCNFFDLASLISQADFFLGNQSFCWHLAEAIKKPRILELDTVFQNCTSFGSDGYESYHQHGIEYYFNKLFNDGNNGQRLSQAYRQNNNDPTSNNAITNTA